MHNRNDDWKGRETLIAELDRTEKAQQTSDLRYRSLFDHAPDGILIADRQSFYLDANARICQMLGYALHELIGLHASDIVVPEEVPHIGEALEAITGPGDYRRQWQFRRKDGSVFFADVTATAMPDGTLLAMIHDVTARNRVDAALRASDERMRFALEHAHVGIWDMDYRTGVLQWSADMEAQYGVLPGTFEGTHEGFVSRIHPDDRASVLEVIGHAKKHGTDYSVLNRATLPDGSVRWLIGTGRILLDDAGNPLRAVGISQDVTERRALEAQFQQAQKMDAVGRLAGGVAHDFNNLLTVILGFCELLLTDDKPNDLREEITEIQKAGMRATELTRQLLAFSRKEIIAPTLLDLNAILEDMRPMIRRLVREDVKVLIGLGASLRRVTADRGQLEQAVLNLVVNAQDAMPNGGTLTLETANVDLDERYEEAHFAQAAGPYVVLTVTDSGTGMTPEVRDRLFEPFFTTKEVGQGTGLGLAMVHGIVTRSGGSVNVYSEIGRGTAFKLYFPEAAAAETAVDAPNVLPPLRTGTETVLVVEDADGLRALTKRLLERQGYTVLVAADATEALRLLDEHLGIDVMLTDVVMPGLSGPELAALKPLVKVIYMSGYTDETIVQHGVLKPGIAFLNKPFTSEALGRKLREVLDRPR